MIHNYKGDYKIGTYYFDGCPWEIWHQNDGWWLKREDMTIYWPAQDRLMLANILWSNPTVHLDRIHFPIYDTFWMDFDCSAIDFVEWVFPSFFSFDETKDADVLNNSSAAIRFITQIGEYVADWEERKNLTK